MIAPEIFRKTSDTFQKEIEDTFQKEIEDRIQRKVLFYTPEWSFEDNQDFGFALSSIFAYMSEFAIKRLNDAPTRHFLSFLETINASLLPARSARALLTFKLSKGAPENVLIPALTQASASGPDGKPVIFETIKNIMATPANLLRVFSVMNDRVFDNTPSIDGGNKTQFFYGDNRQEHILYIGDKNLFNIKRANIIIYMTGDGLEKLGKPEKVAWEYAAEIKEKEGDKEFTKIIWVGFKTQQWTGNDDKKDNNDNGYLVLEKDTDQPPLAELQPVGITEINGLKSRWIRCRVNDTFIRNLSDIRISNILISAAPAVEKMPSVRLVQGIGELYYKLLAEPADKKLEKIDTLDKLLKLSPEKLAKRLMCSKTRATNILEAAKKAFYDKTGKQTETPAAEITADLAFLNDVPVDPARDILPFGDKPQVFSAFYLASADAFSKKGYGVLIRFDLVPGIPGDADSLPAVSWEYWDGNGWSLLKFKEVEENLGSFVHSGVSKNVGTKTIQLADNASSAKDAYTNMKIEVLGKQICNIKAYNGDTRTITLEEDWKMQPDNASIYRIINDATPVEHTITIEHMPEVKSFAVNGKESYWIRIRLTGGNYGKEYEIQDTNVIKGSYNPPLISNLKISYQNDAGGEKPEYILALNNLSNDFQWKKTDKPPGQFKPFNPLSETDLQAVYFGFDKPLKGGPISLFMQLSEALYPVDFRPDIKWQMLCTDGTWRELDILDETGGFIKSGIVQFSFQDDMKKAELLGRNDLYWVRVMVTGNLFEPGKITFLPSVKSMLRTPESLIKQCGDEYNIFGGNFVKEEPVKLPPDVLGFYLNSAWAVQSSSINDEIIGSGTAESNQAFRLLNAPVIDATIRVNEAKTLSEKERKALSLNPAEFLEKKDNEGNVSEFWVKWNSVDDFIDSKPGDRHYIIDTTGGEIRFGDGKNGMVPPIGENNIMATYSTGGGKSGNLEDAAISKLKSAIAFVDKVANPVPSDGGSDMEEIDMLIKRAPFTLKHRNKAVALSDYELLAKESSRKVARVKVLPNFDELGKFRTGTVTVIIVPESTDARPSPSPELRWIVEQYLKKKSPNIAELYVIRPSYVNVSIRAEIITNKIEALPVIEKKAKTAITDFLHPLKGGIDGQGWSFGATPCISDIYSILSRIENVYQVNQVVIELEDESKKIKKELTGTSELVRLPEYSLPCSGEHDIKIAWQEGKG